MGAERARGNSSSLYIQVPLLLFSKIFRLSGTISPPQVLLTNMVTIWTLYLPEMVFFSSRVHSPLVASPVLSPALTSMSDRTTGADMYYPSGGSRLF